MDRLFRKRTVSTKEAHGIPVRSNSFSSDPVWPEKAALLRKKQKGKGVDNVEERPSRGASPAMKEAPKLELDYRNSLIFPGLSQRFSILLPSLSAIPASSLRDELASQRQRGGAGPALTEEEEELLIAELQDMEAYKNKYALSPLSDSSEWEGQPPLPSAFSSTSLASSASESESRRYRSGYSSSGMTSSSSTPNLLGTASPSSMSSSPPVISPPPTSTSFDSFATFGVRSSPTDERNAIRTKSYGFSGGSGMRDHDYIRRVKKSASNRNLSGSTSRSMSIRSDDSQDTAGRPELPQIAVGEANAYWAKGKKGMGSPTGSDRTATPTSGYASPPVLSNGMAKRHHSPSSSLSLNLPPPQPAPSAALPPVPANEPSVGRPQKQRKSMLQGLTPAQMRRISAALVEIGQGLQKGGGPVPMRVKEDEEETLHEPESSTRPSQERHRYLSNARSEGSEHSTGSSSVFPYHVSPTTSSFTTAIQPPSEPSSPPARPIPASPKSRDLQAHITPSHTGPSPIPQPNFTPSALNQPLVIAEATRPVPILTPTKSRPVRHNSSLSTDSASPVASSIPRYIPGQPRPVGSVSGSVRSDDSGSSRSATPTNPHAQRVGGINLSSSPNGGRNRSDSNPSPSRQPPVATRSTSLARSQSVQQSGSPNNNLSPPLSSHSQPSSSSGYPSRRGVVHTLSQRGVRRPNSPLVMANSRDDIDEADEREGGSGEVRIREVPSRRSVATSRSDSIGSSLHSPHPGARPEIARAPSQQGFISSYPEAQEDSTTALGLEPQRRAASLSSIGSSYHGSIESGDGGFSSFADVPMTPEEEQIGELRTLTGMEKEEFSEMQTRLVDRAKEEREALLGAMAERSFSPVPQVTASRSFPVDLRAMSPQPLPASRALSPPPLPTYRATTPDISAPRETPTSPVQLGNVITPIAAAGAVPTITDRRPAPPPPTSSPPAAAPSEAHDEISTPRTDLSPQGSGSQPRSGKTTTPGDDPEKIRDFEARIAAATAALHRTPTSGSGSKLERKNTKTGKGPMVIGTPRLLSSSVNLASKRLDPNSPEMAVDTHTAKALENASGSSKKMSLRWRKLGFGKKGPSISSGEIFSPPLPQATSASTSPNLKTLEEPIALSAGQQVIMPAPGADLKDFKFPNSAASDRPIMPTMSSTGSGASTGTRSDLTSPPGTANPTTGLRQMMGKFRRGKSDEVGNLLASGSPIQGASQSSTAPSTASSTKASGHAPTASDDSAMAKFIAAGKAVGLNDAQLHEMLLANGMLQRSTTTGSARSAASQANTSGFSVASPSPLTPSSTTMASMPAVAAKAKEVEEEKEKGAGGGIFRALSRKKSKAGLAPKRPDEAGAEPAESRNKIVRRTLLLPEALPVTPQPNRSPNPNPSPNINLDSPTNISFGRKPSTRRKPIPLTQEDQRLVAGDSLRDRQTSQTSISTDASVGREGQTAGLGFLHPLSAQEGDVGASDTSGGSLYDLYGNAEDDGSNSGNKGIEIMEYEDGRVVWGVIDALRDDEADESDYTQGGQHSRQTSYASSHLVSEANEVAAANGWKGSVAPLQLRHRERGSEPPLVRPETNLYFTSPTDIGDLIDQLSRDPGGNKGRIDFFPPSPDPTHTTHPSTSTPPLRAAPGQFEDAPSPPRKAAPSPIIIARTNNIPAGGFSPKRQKHIRQGGFGRPGGGSIGGNAGLGIGAAGASPSAASFTSSTQSGEPGSGKGVEDRLQALMDRLVSSGATRKV